MTRERLWPTILSGWLLASAILCIALAPDIARLRFPDPDDAMRLLEVRDWLGGQSWWDVGQHRLNGGDFPMHWSRLVDLPIAAAMLIADPVFGADVADRIAMTIVPLATLFAVMAAAALLTRRLAGIEPARLAVLLAPLSIQLLFQLRPMRIDHHGWQIALAVAAMLALVGRPTARHGMLAGLALGTLVTISLEGLPIAATIAAVAALAWAWDPARRHFLVGLLGAFFAGALAFHVATRGPGMFAASCDAMSPGWLAVLATAAATVTIATLINPASSLVRISALAAAGAACIATLLAIAPACAHGPFASLDPLVRTVWYDNVSEGLPIWHQTAAWAAITIALPLVGLLGTITALRRSEGDARTRWLLMAAVLVPSILLSCLVNRTGATANALALPGAASLLLVLLTRARAIGPVLPRTVATAGALIAASPGLPAGAALTIARASAWPSPTFVRHGATSAALAPCDNFADIRALGTLPPGTVFLPLDVTPDLIATTRHQAIAGGYHRNVGAMHKVLSAFTGSAANAEAIIRAAGATYVAGCPLMNETEVYKAVAPHGFWARLESGERFGWLAPIAIPGSPVLVWRVIDSSRKPLSHGGASF